MRGQTHSSTFRLPTFIRSQRNLVRESKKRRGDTKSNSAIPTQTGSELGCLSLPPKACDESTLRGLRPRNGVPVNDGRDLRTRCRAPKHNRRTRFARPALRRRSAQSQLHSHAQNASRIQLRNCLERGRVNSGSSTTKTVSKQGFTPSW